MPELPFLSAVTRLEGAAALDPITDRIHDLLDAVLKPRALEDALHGVQVGHPVHPVLVQVPTGAWMSAAVLDLLPGTSRAARLLVGVGVLAAAPAILAGWADWARSKPAQRRVGVVHAAANEAGTMLYAASWLARRRGADGLGRAASFAALGLIGVGGYLGGHLAYRQAVGVNHAAGLPDRFPDGWQAVCPLDDLPEGRPVRRDVAGEPLLVLRRGGRVDALSNVCTHLAGALDEGGFEDVGGEACVSCPLHDSVFDMETGEVVHGPATAPQPRFDTRVAAGVLEVRLPA